MQTITVRLPNELFARFEAVRVRNNVAPGAPGDNHTALYAIWRHVVAEEKRLGIEGALPTSGGLYDALSAMTVQAGA